MRQLNALSPQSVFVLRDEDEMDVIGHQTPRPNANARFVHRLGQPVAVGRRCRQRTPAVGRFRAASHGRGSREGRRGRELSPYPLGRCCSLVSRSWGGELLRFPQRRRYIRRVTRLAVERTKNNPDSSPMKGDQCGGTGEHQALESLGSGSADRRAGSCAGPGRKTGDGGGPVRQDHLLGRRLANYLHRRRWLFGRSGK